MPRGSVLDEKGIDKNKEGKTLGEKRRAEFLGPQTPILEKKQVELSSFFSSTLFFYMNATPRTLLLVYSGIAATCHHSTPVISAPPLMCIAARPRDATTNASLLPLSSSLVGNVGICVCWLHPSNDRHFVCRRHVDNVIPTCRQHSVMSAIFLAVGVMSVRPVTDTHSCMAVGISTSEDGTSLEKAKRAHSGKACTFSK